MPLKSRLSSTTEMEMDGCSIVLVGVAERSADVPHVVVENDSLTAKPIHQRTRISKFEYVESKISNVTLQIKYITALIVVS